MLIISPLYGEDGGRIPPLGSKGYMYDLDHPPKAKLDKVKKLKMRKPKKTKVWTNSDIEQTYTKNQ